MKWCVLVGFAVATQAWGFSSHRQSMPFEASLNAHEVGNGGDVLFCDDGRVLMYDLVEGELGYGFEYDWLSPTESPVDNVLHVLDHWRAIDPTTVDLLQEDVQTFFDQVRFVEDAEFRDVPDSNHDYVLEGCEVRQIAIRRVPEFPRQKRYMINRGLWENMLDNTHRAALILHEIIYNRAAAERHEDSRAARYLATFIASTDYQVVSAFEYLDTLRAVDIFEVPKGIYADGILVSTKFIRSTGTNQLASIEQDTEWRLSSGDTVVFRKNSDLVFGPLGRVRYGKIRPKFLSLPGGSEVELREIEVDNERAIVGGKGLNSIKIPLFGGCELSWSQRFSVYDNGALRTLRSQISSSYSIEACLPGALGTTRIVKGYLSSYDDNYAAFFENGIPQLLDVFEQELPIESQGNILVRGTTTFFPSGAIATTHLARDTELVVVGGERKVFPRGMHIAFQEDGYVVAH